MRVNCSNCGDQTAEGAKFCTRCGTPVPQAVSPEMASAGRDYQRFLTLDSSGGFLATVAPVLIWSGAVSVLVWSIIGLISLRFDIGALIDLPDLMFSMLIMIGIALNVAANYYLSRRSRDRGGHTWFALSILPFIWGSLISAGLLLMILQVWTNFEWGPDDLRRTMFSLIGVGLCGTYGGYLALIVLGKERIYEITRWLTYILLSVIAVEVLDAIWLGSRGLSGEEMMGYFIEAGWTATGVVVVYSIIAMIMAQAKTRKGRIAVLITYLALGIVGFTTAVWYLWDGLSAGAMRFVHGGIVWASITTIGLLLVQHFYRNPEDEEAQTDRESENAETGSDTLSTFLQKPGGRRDSG